MTFMGAYNCDPYTDAVKVYCQLQGYIVGSGAFPDTYTCMCGNCGEPYTLANTAPTTGWPQYNYSGLNTIEIILLNNDICLSYINVTLNYTIPPPVATSVKPTDGPVDGGTVVTVTGSNFDNYTYCSFDDQPASGTLLSSTLLQCTSPPAVNGSGVVAFDVKTAETSRSMHETATVAGNLQFNYYAQVVLEKVSPSEGGTDGGTDLTVSGEQLFDSGYIHCRFVPASNRTQAVVAGGFVSGHVTCITPEWTEAETVYLSVTLNNQQYSNALHFKFKREKAQTYVWLIAGVAGLCFVLVIALIALWIRYKRNMDGYKRIRDGNQDIDMREVKLGELIGKGTFGEVYKATWRGATIAVKRLPALPSSKMFLNEFQKEIILMKSLRHPHILQFLGSSMNPPDICIAIEFMCRGSLYSILHNYSVDLSWQLTISMLVDASSGCLYLHSCKPPIVHRDLKSHNLLVDEFWRVKVCDFGLSTFIEQTSQSMTACGTPCWTAPEVMRHLHYSEKADVYSFGMVMWECLTRSEPFPKMPVMRVLLTVAHEHKRPLIPDWAPDIYVKLLTRCWADEPNLRPEFAEILPELEAMHAELDSMDKPQCVPEVPEPLEPLPENEQTPLLGLSSSPSSPTSGASVSSRGGVTLQSNYGTGVTVDSDNSSAGGDIVPAIVDADGDMQ
eukprot:TRINITY_DN331_c0_g1_i2.p1 TRINITY_DN331_c0_g1~~TRINITY_DN331_c0_g1_i2.p1  ORF type:complete len:768 (-),score=181.30 TRINITY_DN331_c0_g1_i2:130-2145(-)